MTRPRDAYRADMAEVQRRVRPHREREGGRRVALPGEKCEGTFRARDVPAPRPRSGPVARLTPPPPENPAPWPRSAAWGVLLAIVCVWLVLGLLARALVLGPTALAALGQAALAVALALGFGLALRAAERLGDRQ